MDSPTTGSDQNSGSEADETGFSSEKTDEVQVGGGNEVSFGSDLAEDDTQKICLEEVVVDDEKFVSAVDALMSADSMDVLWSKLDEIEDLVINDDFVIRVLQTNDLSVASMIGFIRWAFQKSDLVKTCAVLDLLVQEICGSATFCWNEAFTLWDFVRFVGEDNSSLVSVATLNQIIASFAKFGKYKVAMEVFDKFEDLGCVCNGDTYHLTILALGKRSWASTASRVCAKMVSEKMFPDGEKVGDIIKFFCRGGKVDEALMVYKMATETGKCAPPASMEYLIHHMSLKDDTVLKGLELLEDEYSGKSQEPFTSIISGLCRIKDHKNARKLLDRMMESGPSPGKGVFNIVITAITKAGELEDAVALLKIMDGRGLKPDIRAYNVIMSGFAKGGQMDEALKIFQNAKTTHSKLGRVSYHILTQGYNRMEEFESSLKWFYEMKEEGLQPNLDEYRKMIQSLCLKALDWRTAEKLVEEMKENGLKLDGQTCGLVAAVKQLESEEMAKAGLATTLQGS